MISWKQYMFVLVVQYLECASIYAWLVSNRVCDYSMN